MDPWTRFTDEEQKLLLATVEDFNSSLDLQASFSQARERLSRLIPLDALALCVSRPGEPLAYDWIPFGLAPEFYDRYPEVAPHDFVQQRTTSALNEVLVDEQMVSRESLVRNPMYLLLRELGHPVEQCMSVAFHTSPEWHGGLTFYRSRRRPFSAQHQALLRWLTPWLSRTISHCRAFGQVQTQSRLLEELVRRQGACLVFEGAPLRMRVRTPEATALLAKWFSASEGSVQGLPLPVWERLSALSRDHGRMGGGSGVLDVTGKDKSLRVVLEAVPAMGANSVWWIRLEERPHAIAFPESWRSRLTPRVAQTVACALRFWDYGLIAAELGIKEDTVKQHMDNAFDKLGVGNFKKLVVLALRS